MSKPSARKYQLFDSIYEVLMLAYPADFRREYGPHMSQLLRDCQREAQTGLGLVYVWLRTLLDLARTVPGEHLENLRKENHFMSKFRTDLFAIIGCVLIIVTAVLLLNYGRSHQIPSILIFGYALDAVVAAGIAGNLIVFLLVKLTNLNPLRVALWTFLIVNAVPAIALTVIARRFDPQFQLVSTVIGYVVSFLFWYLLHWLWAQKNKSAVTT